MARITQQAKLNRKAQAIRVTAALADQRQVWLTERVVSDDFVPGVGQCKQAGAVVGGED